MFKKGYNLTYVKIRDTVDKLGICYTVVAVFSYKEMRHLSFSLQECSD